MHTFILYLGILPGSNHTCMISITLIKSFTAENHRILIEFYLKCKKINDESAFFNLRKIISRRCTAFKIKFVSFVQNSISAIVEVQVEMGI